MELNRRKFCTIMMTACAALFGGHWGTFIKTGPNRVVRLVQAKLYPGRVKPLDEGSIAKPGHWLG